MAETSRAGISNWRVSDVMSSPLRTCPADMTLVDAAALMASERIHFLALVDPAHPDNDDEILGVLTDLDLVSALDHGPSSRQVSEVAGPPTDSIPADASLRVAVHEMRERRAHHLLVVAVNSGRPVGVVSTIDVAQALAVAPGE